MDSGMRVTEKIESILTNMLPRWWYKQTLRKKSEWEPLDDYGDVEEMDEAELEKFVNSQCDTIDGSDVMSANLISSMEASSTFWLGPEGVAMKAEIAEWKADNPKGYRSEYRYPFGSSRDIPDGGWHRPIIDLDMGAKLISSSSGNNHLFIDKLMSWETYKTLLQALAAAGLVEQGYVDASIARGQTDARLPWIQKGDEMEGYPDGETETPEVR